jgi:hypothetical protein
MCRPALRDLSLPLYPHSPAAIRVGERAAPAHFIRYPLPSVRAVAKHHPVLTAALLEQGSGEQGQGIFFC